MKKKIVALFLVFALVLALGIGGTIAWLTDVTDSVTNTFSVGNIDITLAESNTGLDTDDKDTTNTYKIIPGEKLAKDPIITVTEDSEYCYVFVKVEEVANGGSTNETRYIQFDIADGWTALKDASDVAVSGVYWQVINETNTTRTFNVLKGDASVANGANGIITVNGALVDKAYSDSLTRDKDPVAKPQLVFTAAAVQEYGSTSAYDAWTKLPSTLTGISE